MPLVDKPMSELLTYQGVNPRPADFDQYWDESIAEMAAIDPQVELRPNTDLAVRHAECFDMWFTGVGGARIHAKYLRPVRREKKCPAVVVFHGYSGQSGEWSDYMTYVLDGFCVAVLDARGQAGQSEDNLQVKGTTLNGHIIRGLDDPNPKNLLFRQIYLDTAQLARIVIDMPEVDGDRVGAFGGSQGGGLTLACAALEPRIKRAAPTYPFLTDYRRVWDMDLCKGAYAELNYFFRTQDPMHKRIDAIFNRLGYIDVQHLMPRVKASVLMGIGLMDTICPPSTQMAAYNKITSPKQLAVYPDFAHEGLPGFPAQVFNFMAELNT